MEYRGKYVNLSLMKQREIGRGDTTESYALI
jgi:hypothetical protein